MDLRSKTSEKPRTFFTVTFWIPKRTGPPEGERERGREGLQLRGASPRVPPPSRAAGAVGALPRAGGGGPGSSRTCDR